MKAIHRWDDAKILSRIDRVAELAVIELQGMDVVSGQFILR